MSHSFVHYWKSRVGLGRRNSDVAADREQPAPGVVESADTPEVGAAAKLIAMLSGPSRKGLATNELRIARTRLWRRRVLLRRGALIHASMGTYADRCSLAMLDEDGIVVSWHHRDDRNGSADRVVNGHVSQFYVAEDLAREQPAADLHTASLSGRHVRQGWRRQPDGMAFWGTTVIETVQRRDGRLQGFSHVTCPTEGPCATCPPP